MREKKFSKSNLIFAILCAVYIAAYIIFYFTFAQSHSKDRPVLAVIVVGGLISVVAIVTLVVNVRYCLTYRKYITVMRYGTDVVCTIFDSEQIKYNDKKRDTKFALVLHYFYDGIEKSYTTGYDFCEAEYEYLKELKEIECRCFNGTLFVTEKIPDKIYKNLTTYGKIESKFVYIFLKIWQILAVIGVIIFLSGIALTIAVSDKLFIIVGAACCFGINILCGIVYAICFFAGKY